MPEPAGLGTAREHQALSRARSRRCNAPVTATAFGPGPKSPPNFRRVRRKLPIGGQQPSRMESCIELRPRLVQFSLPPVSRASGFCLRTGSASISLIAQYCLCCRASDTAVNLENDVASVSCAHPTIDPNPCSGRTACDPDPAAAPGVQANARRKQPRQSSGSSFRFRGEPTV
jgi:hypothetical protein